MQYFIIPALAAIAAALSISDPDCNYGTDGSKKGALNGVNDLNTAGDRICAQAQGGSVHALVYCDSTGTGVWVNNPDQDARCDDIAEALSVIVQKCDSNSARTTVHGQVPVNGGNNGGYFVEVGSLGGSPCSPNGVQ